MSAPRLCLLRNVTKTRTTGSAQFQLNVSELSILRGERIAILGPSGSGKSTLLDILGLILAPDSTGDFEFDISGSNPLDVGALWRAGDQARLTRQRADAIGYVLQTGGLLPFLTVGENILLPLEIRGHADTSHFARIATELGIGPLLTRMPERLSVGERQRVAIARALITRPALIIADEPTASLDEFTATAVLRLLFACADEVGATLVLSTHDTRIPSDYNMRVLRHTVSADKSRGVVVSVSG